MAVFSTNQILVELDISADENPTWTQLKDFTAFTSTVGGNVEERDVIDSVFKKRIFTGGIMKDISFEGEFNQSDLAHEFLFKLAMSNDVHARNDRQIRFSLPIVNKANNTKRTITYKGVIQITTNLGSAATELSKLTFDFLVNGAPTITTESNKK